METFLSWPLLVLNFGKDLHDAKHDAVVRNFVWKFLFTPKRNSILGGALKRNLILAPTQKWNYILWWSGIPPPPQQRNALRRKDGNAVMRKTAAEYREVTDLFVL